MILFDGFLYVFPPADVIGRVRIAGFGMSSQKQDSYTSSSEIKVKCATHKLD